MKDFFYNCWLICLTILIAILYTIIVSAIPTFIVFLILKLCAVINWSWIIICVPIIAFPITLVLLSIINTFKEDY